MQKRTEQHSLSSDELFAQFKQALVMEVTTKLWADCYDEGADSHTVLQVLDAKTGSAERTNRFALELLRHLVQEERLLLRGGSDNNRKGGRYVAQMVALAYDFYDQGLFVSSARGQGKHGKKFLHMYMGTQPPPDLPKRKRKKKSKKDNVEAKDSGAHDI